MCCHAWLYRLLACTNLSELSAPAELVTKGARVLVRRSSAGPTEFWRSHCQNYKYLSRRFRKRNHVVQDTHTHSLCWVYACKHLINASKTSPHPVFPARHLSSSAHALALPFFIFECTIKCKSCLTAHLCAGCRWVLRSGRAQHNEGDEGGQLQTSAQDAHLWIGSADIRGSTKRDWDFQF